MRLKIVLNRKEIEIFLKALQAKSKSTESALNSELGAMLSEKIDYIDQNKNSLESDDAVQVFLSKLKNDIASTIKKNQANNDSKSWFSIFSFFTSEVKSSTTDNLSGPMPEYQTPEHKALGDAQTITLYDKDSGEVITTQGSEKAKVISYPNGVEKEYSEGSEITSGDIVSYAGDYFADKIIAEGENEENQKRRFLASYRILANAPDELIQKINELNDESGCFDNQAFNSYLKEIKFMVDVPEYLKHLENNVDHFVPWAKTAYETGHAVALYHANKARNEKETQDSLDPDSINYDKANKLSIYANQLDDFACHYLSDNFSGGHLRLKELRKSLGELSTCGGLLANQMHNEDGDDGVECIIDGKPVRVYGDGKLNDPENSQTKLSVGVAMQASKNEIAAVLNGVDYQDKKSTAYLPEPLTSDEAKKQGLKQNAPMFKESDDGKSILYRDPITELNEDLVSYKTLGRLEAMYLVFKLMVEGVEATYTDDVSDKILDNTWVVIPSDDQEVDESILKPLEEKLIELVQNPIPEAIKDFSGQLEKATKKVSGICYVR